MSGEVLAACNPSLQVEQMSGPPREWAQLTLGDILTLEYGRSLPDKSRRPGAVPVYGSNGVVGWHDEALVPKGGIIIGRKGTAGSVTVSSDAFWPIDTTYFVKPRQTVDWDWLAATLHHARLNELNEATGVPGLNRDKAYLQPILLPSLDEQRRIAEVLRSVDEAIAANRDTLDQVARARAAILHAAFEETPWEVVQLGELGSWQSGGTPSKDDEAKWGGDVPWVCPRDMKTPVIRQTHSTLTPLALGGSCKLVPRGTLMIVVRGMILAKAIPTATIAMDATFNQDMKAFRPNGRALPKFVQLCLQHQEQQLLRVVNTATHGTKKLDTDTLLSVSVPLPDLETQQGIADAVSDLDFALVMYGEEHIRLSTVKQAIMSDLLSGRVRVPA
ncbi:restriction endonuclease subunit S [Sphingopyxis yananensis]|uniref:restriction endonuclease subunit S n=1 Tax=Sphingopyxis yananensis TaxID=2886687 RepID=UPI001D10AD90|nr:restriction endonuclease subunit S [Sphingopyxis yananensis]MCC2601600.1 restriction endonuclease subunit S [Sphingopyxis yananensis]